MWRISTALEKKGTQRRRLGRSIRIYNPAWAARARNSESWGEIRYRPTPPFEHRPFPIGKACVVHTTIQLGVHRSHLRAIKLAKHRGSRKRKLPDEVIWADLGNSNLPEKSTDQVRPAHPFLHRKRDRQMAIILSGRKIAQKGREKTPRSPRSTSSNSGETQEGRKTHKSGQIPPAQHPANKGSEIIEIFDKRNAQTAVGQGGEDSWQNVVMQHGINRA